MKNDEIRLNKRMSWKEHILVRRNPISYKKKNNIVTKLLHNLLIFEKNK